MQPAIGINSITGHAPNTHRPTGESCPQAGGFRPNSDRYLTCVGSHSDPGRMPHRPANARRPPRRLRADPAHPDQPALTRLPHRAGTSDFRPADIFYMAASALLYPLFTATPGDFGPGLPVAGAGRADRRPACSGGTAHADGSRGTPRAGWQGPAGPPLRRLRGPGAAPGRGRRHGPARPRRLRPPGTRVRCPPDAGFAACRAPLAAPRNTPATPATRPGQVPPR